MSGIRVDCGGGISALAAPLLKTAETVRTLPDATASVARYPTSLDAVWPDGVHLGLRLSRARTGRILSVSVKSAHRLTVDGLGVRLSLLGATRLLVDGYHSWDWAGVRDATAPGRGWWGGLWGVPHASTALSIGLRHPPRVGALALEWDGQGHLDAIVVGEPRQLRDRTASPEPLGVALAPHATLRADDMRVSALDRNVGTGAVLPSMAAGDHRPRSRKSGWMSWNCLGPDVCGADVIEAAQTLVPDGGVALLDDGWMPFWGDWHERDDLDMSIADLATALLDMRRSLGVWLAPFLVDPQSDTAASAATMLLRDSSGQPVVDHRPARPQYVLDASREDVRAHLAEIGERMAHDGVGALKLDFLYAAALPGIRRRGWSGVRALRDGVRALADAYRRSAPRTAAVWACGAPGPPLVGLVDACRSGGDAVVNVPTAGADPPPEPWFAHGEAILRAQARNLAARAWLWGATLPPDVDAVTVGAVGYAAPAEDGQVHGWLEMARRSGGPLLDADEPTASTLLPQRLDDLRAAQHAVMGTRPAPARPVDPLSGRPAPMEDATFLSWPDDLPDAWDR